MVHAWRTEGSFVRSVLSFHLHVFGETNSGHQVVQELLFIHQAFLPALKFQNITALLKPLGLSDTLLGNHTYYLRPRGELESLFYWWETETRKDCPVGLRQPRNLSSWRAILQAFLLCPPGLLSFHRVSNSTRVLCTGQVSSPTPKHTGTWPYVHTHTCPSLRSKPVPPTGRVFLWIQLFRKFCFKFQPQVLSLDFLCQYLSFPFKSCLLNIRSMAFGIILFSNCFIRVNISLVSFCFVLYIGVWMLGLSHASKVLYHWVFTSISFFPFTFSILVLSSFFLALISNLQCILELTL